MQQILKSVLRPLVRIMLRNSVDVSEFTTALREAYVEVATEQEFEITDKQGKPKKTTLSRISTLTGINRKEVKRIVENDQASKPVASVNRAFRVISGWVNDADFCDKAGKPLDLIYSASADKISFEQLVKRYSGDLTARVILDELVRSGVVERQKNTVVLLQSAYVPREDQTQLLKIGAVAIKDLINTIGHNVELKPGEPSRLQLGASYNNVSEEGKQLFKSILKKDAMEFMAQQNKILASLDRKNNPNVDGTGRYRVGVGVYYVEEPVNEAFFEHSEESDK